MIGGKTELEVKFATDCSHLYPTVQNLLGSWGMVLCMKPETKIYVTFDVSQI